MEKAAMAPIIRHQGRRIPLEPAPPVP